MTPENQGTVITADVESPILTGCSGVLLRVAFFLCVGGYGKGF